MDFERYIKRRGDQQKSWQVDRKVKKSGANDQSPSTIKAKARYPKGSIARARGL